MPLLSVILPNYNHATYLDRRMQSILDQSYQDFEVIILDDCSTDNSREIIEKYRSHEKVSHVLYNEVNSGSTFKQWDKGIALAKGDLVWIAESDDYCEPSFLSELIPPMEKDNQLVIAFCQSLFVTPGGKIINKTEANRLENIVTGESFLKKQMLGVNAIANVSMAVLRKSVIASVSPDYKSFKYCGDWLFYTGMCFKGNVFISGKYLNYYLRHENSVTSQVTKMGFDFFEGNQVFHFIKNELQPGAEDINHALQKRIGRYIELKDVLDDSVKQDVLKSILELDPKARIILNKKLRSIQLRKTFSGLKKIIEPQAR